MLPLKKILTTRWGNNSLLKLIQIGFLMFSFGCQTENFSLINNNSIINTKNFSEIANDQIIVKFRNIYSKTEMISFAGKYTADLVNSSNRLNSAILKINTSNSIEILNSLKNDINVDFAEPNYRFSSSYTVSDPDSGLQGGIARTGIAKAWDITMGDPKIIIAIIDSGVDLKHPDLKNKLVPGYNSITQGQTPPQDENGHGTHVAGIAAADTNNKIGIAGVAPKCRVMPVKVLDKNGKGNAFDIALGIYWAVDHGAKVLNLSLGTPQDSLILRRAVNYALLKNTVVVVAMGNMGKGEISNGNILSYPAAIPGVISVGATDMDSKRAYFSYWGKWMSVMAPGVEIYSTLPDKNYGFDQGTSMAAPIVSGIAALVLSRNPGYSPAEVKARIESTAKDLGSPGFDDNYGHGLVNAVKAVL